MARGHIQLPEILSLSVREEVVDEILDKVRSAIAYGFEIVREQVETRWEPYKKGNNVIDVNVDVVYVSRSIASTEHERYRLIANVERRVAQALIPYAQRFGWEHISVTPIPNDGRFTMVTFKDRESDQVIGDNEEILVPVEPQA